MKQALIIIIVALSTNLFGQGQYVGLYNSDNEGIPTWHAEGIFKYFIESDNELRYGNSEKAILALDNAIAQNPFFAESYLKRSVVLQRLGREQEATRDLKRAEQLNPYLTRLFSRQRKEGKMEIIAFDYQNFDNRNTALEAEVFQKKIEQLIAAKLNGEMTKAMLILDELFDAAVRPDPFLYGISGNMYLLTNDYKQAIAEYTQAINLAPDNANYYFNRGIARLFSYNRSAACVDLETSDQLGYAPSQEKIRYFCKF